MNVGTFAEVMMAAYFAWPSGDEVDRAWRYVLSRPAVDDAAAPTDPVLARMWRHADELARMGLTRQAADDYHQAVRQTSYAYRITKAAQNMLTIALAQELAVDAIAVWALHPGTLMTRLGTERADTPPEVAAAALVERVTRRDPTDMRPRFISLDERETDAGDDLPW